MLSSSIHPLAERLTLAGSLSDAARRAVEALPITQRTLQPNTGLVHAGEHSGNCCIVMDGWMSRSKLLRGGERQIFALYIAGDMPDLQSLHLPTADHGIYTLTTATVALIPHEAVYDLMARYRDVAAALWREALVTTSIANEWMIGLGRRQGPRRMAHLFCEIYARHQAAGLVKVEGCCPLPLTQTVLADVLGLTAVHINRMLRDLRDEKLVEHRQRTLTILDWAGLSAFAEFDPTYLHLDRQVSD